MKKIFVTAGIFIAALIVGIAVINNSEANTEVTVQTTRVGLILNGSKDDKSWCQSHYEGLCTTAEELNLSVIYEESVPPEELPERIDEMVEQDCEIIIASTFDYADGMMAAAEKYPGVTFFHATGVGARKNLTTYFGRMYQMRYLCGIVAGLQTKTDKIGYVAAMPISEVNRGINAFALGARSVNPDAEIYVSWTGSWTDDESAEQAAIRLLEEQNIDILTLHTDSIAPLDVAEEYGVFSIGYNIDNSANYPDTYLTAATWDWESFYTSNILKCLQGKFVGAHCWEGVSTGIVSLAPFTDNVDSGIAEAVDKEMQRLLSGTFDVFYGPIKDNSGALRVAAGESMTDDSMLNSFDWYVEGVHISDE